MAFQIGDSVYDRKNRSRHGHVHDIKDATIGGYDVYVDWDDGDLDWHRPEDIGLLIYQEELP